MMSRRSRREVDNEILLKNSVKTLVANIRFASVDKALQTLVVTSSVPDEGKSTISVELARALAVGGRNVLVVEGDLRRRTLAGMLGVHSKSGLYGVLSGQAALDESALRVDGKSTLWFLDAEPHIPNPVDIFSSRRFHRFMESLRHLYDYVIFDTPPLSAFVDAAVLASMADGTLLVARENLVKREEITAAYDQLRKAGANVIGAVVNCSGVNHSEYYRYRSYAHKSDRSDEKG